MLLMVTDYLRLGEGTLWEERFPAKMTQTEVLTLTIKPIWAIAFIIHRLNRLDSSLAAYYRPRQRDCAMATHLDDDHEDGKPHAHDVDDDSPLSQRVQDMRAHCPECIGGWIELGQLFCESCQQAKALDGIRRSSTSSNVSAVAATAATITTLSTGSIMTGPNADGSHIVLYIKSGCNEIATAVLFVDVVYLGQELDVEGNGGSQS
jgi:hypothetical protein